jgi:hypothetical protein
LDAEILPDPSDYFATARYLDRRAEMGDFSVKGTPAFALHVLHYLWRHTARKTDKLGLNETAGWVLSGKSKIGKIATESGISYNAAQRALDWLYQEGWVDVCHEGQSYRWRPALTVEDHEKRTAGGTVTAEGTVPEAGASTVTAEGTAVPAEGTVFSSAVTVFSAEVTHNRESTGIGEGSLNSVPATPGGGEEINERDQTKYVPQILDYVREHPGASGEEISRELGYVSDEVRRAVREAVLDISVRSDTPLLQRSWAKDYSHPRSLSREFLYANENER